MNKLIIIFSLILSLSLSITQIASYKIELNVQPYPYGNDAIDASDANDVVANYGDSDCKKEVRKQCGKEIDEFKKQVGDTSILGIIKSAADLVECFISKADKIASKCFPGEEKLSERDVEFINSFAIAQDSVAKYEPSCRDVVVQYCKSDHKNLESILSQTGSPREIMDSTHSLISCFIAHQEEISEKCTDMKAVVYIGKVAESNCHKELYKKCGEPLGKLKDAIEEVSILGIISSAFETASCITENLSDIVEACTDNDNIEASSTASKGVIESSYNGKGNDDESKCHNELYNLCGKELGALKRGIQHTSPNGIVGASLELAGCITINFVRLVKACSPFEKSAKDPSQLLSQFQKTEAGASGSLHFDFYDCVEMAKNHMQNNHYGAYGRYYYNHHSHGFFFLFIAVALISAFIKGYLVGKSVLFCRARLSNNQNTSGQTNDVYASMKDVSVVPSA